MVKKNQNWQRKTVELYDLGILYLFPSITTKKKRDKKSNTLTKLRQTANLSWFCSHGIQITTLIYLPICLTTHTNLSGQFFFLISFSFIFCFHVHIVFFFSVSWKKITKNESRSFCRGNYIHLKLFNYHFFPSKMCDTNMNQRRNKQKRYYFNKRETSNIGIAINFLFSPRTYQKSE